jgi:hypothetical protein
MGASSTRRYALQMWNVAMATASLTVTRTRCFYIASREPGERRSLEHNPRGDIGGMTAMTAAKLMKEVAAMMRRQSDAQHQH